jgi:GTP-binding protein Era
MSHPPPRSGRVAIVGRPNVGKSTLLNALLGEPIAITSSHPQTTRSTVRGVLTDTTTGTQFVFVDTPGLHTPRTRLGEHMNLLAREAAREADAIVVVVEARGADKEEPGLLAELPEKRTVVAVNKIDRLKDKTALLPRLSALGEGHAFAAIVPISARRADGTTALLTELRELLPEQPFLYEPDTLSDQPTRFFVAEFVREQILAHTRQEVPHGVAVVVERFDESGKVPHIELAIHVVRESHKKILIGAGGQMLKAIGTEARARVEQMMGTKVHLQLWVRVTPGWMDDPAKMRELGYGQGDDGTSAAPPRRGQDQDDG